jgi:NDP-sugar pyrophosphorylase family protein
MDVTGAILAGGLGTRLRSVVADRPKVLAPVAGRPFLYHLLDQIADADIPEVVLLTGHLGEQVEEELGDSYRGMRLLCSQEPTPLGTGGALRAALGYLHSPVVLLLNGDSFIDVDLHAFHRFHVERQAPVSMTLTRVPDTSRYGQVRLDRFDRVLHFEEKAKSEGPGWINAGVYLLARGVVEAIPATRPISLERDVLADEVARERVHGYRHEGRFIDIGTPESFAQAAACLWGRDFPAQGASADARRR